MSRTLQLQFSPFPAMRTKRLSLRPVEDADADAIFFLRSDPRVLKYLDRAPAQSIAEAEAHIQLLKDGIQNDESISWGICLHDDPQLLGTIGFWRMQRENLRAEIGYALHPDFQGKGIMQEAIEPVLDYGFRVMGLHSVEANVNPNNLASIRLLERNGFVREAYYRENWYYEGRFLDSAVYSLLERK